MTEPAIQLKNVSKIIGKKTIIDDLSFDIYPGEVFGFLGPNGAGKTTTIRMIVGLMKMTKGEIMIQGHSIATDFKGALHHVGAIVENPELYKFLSGWKNLVHYARMHTGMNEERIKEVVSLVGLENRIKDKVKTYSLGMRQRLGLAQALLHKPSVLILDEPTNGLDPAGIREIREYIRRLAEEEGLAVVVSSHLLSEMEMMCDRIGIIQDGKLVGVQTVDEFVKGEADVRVKMTVTPLEKAKDVLINALDITPEIEEKRLIVTLEHELIPQAVKHLVQNDIDVYSVDILGGTLEDKFLEVTGGQAIG